MSEHSKPRFTGLCHIGVHSDNPATLAEFYREVMGMQIVGGSDQDSPLGASTFLSSRPDEESHEIVFFSNSDFCHAAFKVASVTDLRAWYQDVVGRGIPIKMAVNHGVSLAFYFDDPEGNMVEIYWPTRLAYGQPYAHPIDLTLDEEALLQDVANLAAREDIPWSASPPPT